VTVTRPQNFSPAELALMLGAALAIGACLVPVDAGTRNQVFQIAGNLVTGAFALLYAGHNPALPPPRTNAPAEVPQTAAGEHP